MSDNDAHRPREGKGTHAAPAHGAAAHVAAFGASASVSSSPSSATIRSIPLDKPSLDALWDRLDVAGANQASDQRQAERFLFRVQACIVFMQQPGAASPTAFLVPTRNLSSSGLSFLHGGFVHSTTRCLVQLITTYGTWSDVPGSVVRCRYVEGRVHEIGIRFDQEIRPEDYCPAALKCRVLLAEDDPSSARLATCHLNQFDAEVDHAENGREAVDMALANTYDVILMDMDMPVLDGWEAVKELRGKGYSGVIVALTALTQPEDREKCLAVGCDQYLAKPFVREELMSLLESLKKEPLVSTFQGDASMAPLIHEFVTALPGKLRALEEAMQRDELSQLQILARTLKGEAGGYGFDLITEAAVKVETAVINKMQPSEVKTLVSDLVKWCLLARSSARMLQPYDSFDSGDSAD